jgi:hypothetical protein
MQRNSSGIAVEGSSEHFEKEMLYTVFTKGVYAERNPDADLPLRKAAPLGCVPDTAFVKTV